MTRPNANFKNTYIYKLETKDGVLLYVDFTTNQMVKKTYYKRDWKTKDLPIMKLICEYGGWDNINFTMIEPLQVTNKMDASILTEYYIEKNRLAPILGVR